MNAKEFLENYWCGIDVKSQKPILITVEQLAYLMDKFATILKLELINK